MVSPGKRTKLKDFINANPLGSKNDLVLFLMTKPLFDCGKDKARDKVLPNLKEMGLIEEFEGEKKGLKPTLHYRFLDKKSETEVPKIDDETNEPF